MSAFEFAHHHVWKVNRDGAIQCDECDYILDPEAVIHDIETAQRRYAAAMEIVQAVAASLDGAGMVLCNHCDEYVGGVLCREHTPECPVTQARALLAAETGAARREETGKPRTAPIGRRVRFPRNGEMLEGTIDALTTYLPINRPNYTTYIVRVVIGEGEHALYDVEASEATILP